jgi:tRNA-Thr(GGU) m(6)t(6)A37 methyltransferase TsaA
MNELEQMQIHYRPIGVIHTPFQTLQGMPIQPTGARRAAGQVELLPEFAEGLQDLDGFSHIILIYHFHQVHEMQLTLTPFLDSQVHGVFATRAPKRPNPIGLSIVKLVRVQENLLFVEDIDVLDQTPLLDIKPYVPEFDQPAETRVGWLEKSKGQVANKRSDDRFL